MTPDIIRAHIEEQSKLQSDFHKANPQWHPTGSWKDCPAGSCRMVYNLMLNQMAEIKLMEMQNAANMPIQGN